MKFNYWLLFNISGSTWLSELVSLIASNGDFEEANKVHLVKRVPHLGMQIPGAPSVLDLLKEMLSPRIIKTHLYFDLLSTEIEKAKPKIIVLQRNPKDCLASFFHHYKISKGLKILVHAISVTFFNCTNISILDLVIYLIIWLDGRRIETRIISCLSAMRIWRMTFILL